jgi:fructokinase
MSFKLVGIGEVLWDLLPAGPQLGGAPANFAFHAKGLGADAGIISRVGNDELGRAILKRFTDAGISTRSISSDPDAPTGSVEVKLNPGGVPDFIIRENVAWDRLQADEAALREVRKADAVCFGSLAQRSERSRAAVQQLVRATPANALRVFDINLRQHYFTREILESSLSLATHLKLNDSELPVLAGMFGLQGSAEKQIIQLAARFDLRLIAYTKGSNGSLLFQEGRWSAAGSKCVEVADTVGAGDAFTAALVIGLLHGLDLQEVHEFASETAGFVCSQSGATPELPSHLRDRFAPRTVGR